MELTPEKFIELLVKGLPVAGAKVTGSALIDANTCGKCIDLSNCIIDGNLTILGRPGANEKPEYKAIKQIICLDGMTVAGNIKLNGLAFYGIEFSTIKLSANNVKCHGDLALEDISFERDLFYSSIMKTIDAHPLPPEKTGDAQPLSKAMLSAVGIKCDGSIKLSEIVGFSTVNLSSSKSGGQTTLSTILAPNHAADLASAGPPASLGLIRLTAGSDITLSGVVGFVQIDLSLMQAGGYILIKEVDALTLPEAAGYSTDRVGGAGHIDGSGLSCVGNCIVTDVSGFRTLNFSGAHFGRGISFRKVQATQLELVTSISSMLTCVECTFEQVGAFGSQFDFVTMEQLTVSKALSLVKICVASRIQFSSIHAGEIDLERAQIEGELVFNLAREATTECVKKLYDKVKVDLSSQEAELQECWKHDALQRFTIIGRLNLSRCVAKSLDLQYAYFAKSGDQNVARIDLTDGQINGRVVLRRSQFLAWAVDAPKDAKFAKINAEEAKTLVDLSGAIIGELDLARPLPSPIRLTGAIVNGWGLDKEHQTAKDYAEVLNCTGATTLDIPHYLRVEEMFENAGQRSEADEIHCVWRERERALFIRNGQFWRGLTYWLHRETLGYGTKRRKMVGIIFYLWVYSAVLFSWNHDHWLQPDTALQSSLVQCGDICENRIPKPDTVSVPQQIINGTLFALRQNVPLVDFVPVPPYEANPNTPAPYFVMLFRILGWLTWPVLLASIVSGLFPKRYQA